MRIWRRDIMGWCLFDLANSAYTTIIVTVCFNIIFIKLIVGAGEGGSFSQGNLLWAFILSASWLLGAILGPPLGAISDAWGCRKAFLAISVPLCAVSTGFLYFANPSDVVYTASLLLISNLGFSLSENFIAAFLPHISTPKTIGTISGIGWGLGYLGGLGSIILCQLATGLDYSFENYSALKWIGPITGLYFIFGSIPTLLFVKEPTMAQRTAPSTKIIRGALSDFGRTFADLKNYRDLSWFLVSCFFFQGGLSIVISFAAVYGEQVVGLRGKYQATFFITLQLSAALGAFILGVLQNRLGALRCVSLTLFVWLAAVLLIYFLRPLTQTIGITDLSVPFILVGNVAGFCLGATQSSARTLVGLLTPKGKSGEFFGFWGFSNKLAAVFATLMFGLFQRVFSLESAILLCSFFFGAGLLINTSVDERRGRQLAAPSIS